MCCVSRLCHTIDAVDDGNGLESLRRLMNRYGPRTVLSKRAHVKAIMTNTSAKRIEDLEPKLLKLEPHVNRCEALAGRPFDEYFAVTVLVESCVKERSKFDSPSKDLPYKGVRFHRTTSGVQLHWSDHHGHWEPRRRHLHLGRSRIPILGTTEEPWDMEQGNRECGWGGGSISGGVSGASVVGDGRALRRQGKRVPIRLGEK